MFKYILKRLALAIPTFFVVLLISYFMLSSLTGFRSGRITAYGDGDLLDKVFEAVDAEENNVTKFIRYCYDLVTKGDMGPNGYGGRVSDDVAYRLKFTLLLAAVGFGVSVVIGIPAGLYSAVYHNKWQDQVLSAVTLVMASIPSFCLAMFLILLFAVKLHILPTFGIGTPQHYVMPAMVLGAGGIALTARMTRSAVIEVLNKPYITTLRAKGISESRILFCHVLKNSLVPVISVLNNIAVAVLCSTLVVEKFFSVPGLGLYIFDAVSMRSQLKVLGGVVALSVVIILINLVSDVCYSLADPRIRLRLGKGSRSKKEAENESFS